MGLQGRGDGFGLLLLGGGVLMTIATAQLCQVLRPFVGDEGKELPTGTIVDVSGWPSFRIPQMIEQRYIVPVVVVEKQGKEPARVG